MTNKSNRVLVPEAKAGLKRFKQESATEVAVNLKLGYNGGSTARDSESIPYVTVPLGKDVAKKMVDFK